MRWESYRSILIGRLWSHAKQQSSQRGVDIIQLSGKVHIFAQNAHLMWKILEHSQLEPVYKIRTSSTVRSIKLSCERYSIKTSDAPSPTLKLT
jgi:hypothetical protein